MPFTKGTIGFSARCWPANSHVLCHINTWLISIGLHTRLSPRETQGRGRIKAKLPSYYCWSSQNGNLRLKARRQHCISHHLDFPHGQPGAIRISFLYPHHSSAKLSYPPHIHLHTTFDLKYQTTTANNTVRDKVAPTRLPGKCDHFSRNQQTGNKLRRDSKETRCSIALASRTSVMGDHTNTSYAASFVAHRLARRCCHWRRVSHWGVLSHPPVFPTDSRGPRIHSTLTMCRLALTFRFATLSIFVQTSDEVRELWK